MPPNVNFLPLPREHECVEVGVLLGQPGSSFPKEINGGTHLLDEGYLSDGSPVWIIYTVLQIMKPGEPPPPSSRITPKKSYLDPNAEITSNTRAILFWVQPDGSLGFMDCRVDVVAQPGAPGEGSVTHFAKGSHFAMQARQIQDLTFEASMAVCDLQRVDLCPLPRKAFHSRGQPFRKAMFNLLMRGVAWGDGSDTFSRSRLFEYTDEAVAAQFQEGSRVLLNKLIGLPCLFMEEGTTDELAHVGTIIQARLAGDDIALEYTFDREIPPIQNRTIYGRKIEFDMPRDFEFSRSHWAVKDVDLYRVLLRINQPRRHRPTVFTLPDHERIEPRARLCDDALRCCIYERLR